MAHGTDGAGSNRLPPSATGIFGMKPSRDAILGEATGETMWRRQTRCCPAQFATVHLLFLLQKPSQATHFLQWGLLRGRRAGALELAWW